MWYALHRAVFGAWMRRQFRLQVEGRQHAPAAPYLIIANHCSRIDPPLVALAVKDRVSFLCHQGLASNPLKRLWIRSVGGFFIRPGDTANGAIPTALQRLARGHVVCLFPEGTRSRDGRLLPLRTGAAYIALAAGVPVLPVAIIGAHRVMPVGAALWPRPGQVGVRAGAVLRPPHAGQSVSSDLVHEWTERFAAALCDLLPIDQQPGARPIEERRRPGRDAAIRAVPALAGLR